MTTVKTTYTDAEVRLFNAFDIEYYTNYHFQNHPLDTYNLLASDAFEKDLRGPHIEALRRAVKAIKQCNPHRHTPEFDALLHFEEVDQ